MHASLRLSSLSSTLPALPRSNHRRARMALQTLVKIRDCGVRECVCGITCSAMHIRDRVFGIAVVRIKKCGKQGVSREQKGTAFHLLLARSIMNVDKVYCYLVAFRSFSYVRCSQPFPYFPAPIIIEFDRPSRRFLKFGSTGLRVRECLFGPAYSGLQ